MNPAAAALAVSLAALVFALAATYKPGPEPCCCQMVTIPPGFDFLTDPSRVHTPARCGPIGEWAERGCPL